jgi:hypothetical protein
MNDPARPLPPHIQALIDAHLKSVEQPPAPRRDIHQEFADRLNRCRQYDQSKMPPWKDPRAR